MRASNCFRRSRSDQCLKSTPEQPAAAEGAIDGSTRQQWTDFLLVTVAVGGFNFIYELYMIGIAGKCEIVFGHQGLRIFSQALVLNCVLCSVFAVVAR